jgi:1,4-dihydroxy-2-naphthoate octaprenyltransferase
MKLGELITMVIFGIILVAYIFYHHGHHTT